MGEEKKKDEYTGWLIAMMGISFASSRSRFRMMEAASYPVITGILKSIKMASYQ